MSVGEYPIIKISVVIIAYLRKEYIVKAVESVLDQDFHRDKYEIIVIKNFSDTFIDEFLQKNHVLSVLSTHTEIGRKFAEGLRISAGEIVCFLEDDDVFLRSKLSEVYNIFNQHRDLIYFHNNASFIDENGVPIENFSTMSSRGIARVNEMYVKNEDKDNEIFRLFDLGPYWNNSCISLRKSHFLGSLGVLSNIKAMFDGAVFFSALCSDGDILLTGKVLNYYRVNRNSVTQVTKFDDQAYFHISMLNLDDIEVIERTVNASLGKQSKTFARLMVDRMSWELRKLIYSRFSGRRDALKYLLRLVQDHKVSPSLIKSNLLQLSSLNIPGSWRMSRKSKIA